MEHKDYQTGQHQVRHHGPAGGPRMARGGEKAKDFVGTWKKLLGYCRRYRAAIVIALICAGIGTILTLMGPDKLSDMTDTITAGISPNTEKMEEIAQTISQNLTGNTQTVMDAIAANISDEEKLSQKAADVLSSPDLTEQEKQAFQEVMANMSSGAAEDGKRHHSFCPCPILCWKS